MNNFEFYNPTKVIFGKPKKRLEKRFKTEALKKF